MSYVQTSSSAITTTATGAATVYSSEVHNGLVESIVITAVGTTSTADVVITGEDSAVAIMTKANIIKQASTTFHPRGVPNKVADGATTSGSTKVPLAFERIKTVMLGGGNAQAYTLKFFIT